MLTNASHWPRSICYTADGECVLAGGRSKYVCIYAVEGQLLLKRFQLSHNRSVGGVVDQLNTKHMTEAGDMAELDVSGSEDEKRCACGHTGTHTKLCFHDRLRDCACFFHQTGRNAAWCDARRLELSQDAT